jgi:L-alanine-DL-glutamate epimerase-like enolase superfamily enzyme
MPDATDLAARLRALPVEVDSAFALPLGVFALDYPGGLRPSGELHVGGRGCLASGECVSFDEEAQARFAATAATMVLGRRGPLEEVLAGLVAASAIAGDEARHQRAALEGALLDLALRQAGRSLLDLVASAAPTRSATPAPSLRFVFSFEVVADPAARVAALCARTPGARFKVDVDPAWTEEAIAALASTSAVAVLDFKGRGDAELADRLARRFPAALLEDPPRATAVAAERVVLDQALVSVSDVEAAVHAGHGLNIKPARMGGFLAALSALALARAARGAVYIGGMFEVGIGRRQARALAALFTPEGDNDLAPVRGVERSARTSRLSPAIDRPGFGG